MVKFHYPLNHHHLTLATTSPRKGPSPVKPTGLVQSAERFSFPCHPGIIYLGYIPHFETWHHWKQYWTHIAKWRVPVGKSCCWPSEGSWGLAKGVSQLAEQQQLVEPACCPQSMPHDTMDLQWAGCWMVEYWSSGVHTHSQGENEKRWIFDGITEKKLLQVEWSTWHRSERKLIDQNIWDPLTIKTYGIPWPWNLTIKWWI